MKRRKVKLRALVSSCWHHILYEMTLDRLLMCLVTCIRHGGDKTKSHRQAPGIDINHTLGSEMLYVTTRIVDKSSATRSDENVIIHHLGTSYARSTGISLCAVVRQCRLPTIIFLVKVRKSKVDKNARKRSRDLTH